MFNAANMQDAPLSLCVVDTEGRVSFCNTAFEQVIGNIPVGQSIEESLIFDAALSDFLQKSREHPVVVHAQAISDTTLEFQVILTPLEDDSALLLQLIPSGGDAVLQMTSATKPNRLNVDFLSAISHQIRTPVNGVLGIAELLSETGLSPEQSKYVDILSRSGHALIHLVNEIQDIALLEQGASGVSNDTFNVRDLVQDAMDLFSISVSQKGVMGIANIDDTVPDAIVSDRKKLHQILVNLIGNAFQYTDQGKVTVDVRLNKTAKGDQLAIDVIDRGLGIDADRLPDLFNKSTLAASRNGRAYSKTGLGLILCHEFVKLMEGTIEVESELGRGTHVKVLVPVAQADNETVAENTTVTDENTAALHDNEGPWHLLVVEDNPVNQMLFRKILERSGHKVTVASNGQEAVAKVQMGDRFDAILMDISMPVMDGLDATAMIRSLFGPAGSTPILALTAHAMDGDREKFLNAGMDGYQSKPVDPATLEHAIADVIRKRRQAWQDDSDFTGLKQWQPRGSGQEH